MITVQNHSCVGIKRVISFIWKINLHNVKIKLNIYIWHAITFASIGSRFPPFVDKLSLTRSACCQIDIPVVIQSNIDISRFDTNKNRFLLLLKFVIADCPNQLGTYAQFAVR